MGCAPATQKFLNAVVEISCNSEPLELLERLRSIERSLGRRDERAVNAPRTIDLDLLYLGDLSAHSSELGLPHPRLHTRRFVLQPLADLGPDLKLPNHTETVAQLLAKLPNSPAVVRIASQW
jgi:2-amino-4-hydroxy-6-hydroxymethyldihydropteridine diphosphokinase